MKKDRFFVSLGAGVQSSALLLLYYHGKLTPMPDAAIFADTQAEPRYVYDYLDILREKVRDKIPVHIVTAGSLEKQELDPATKVRQNGVKFADCPFFSINADGSRGLHHRQCTANFKIRPLVAKQRLLLGYEPRKRIKEKVNIAIGISVEEWMRGKDSRYPWQKNIYPLIDIRWTRKHCEDYLVGLGLPRPRRSACVFCPFRSNSEWYEMRKEAPESWERAAHFDEEIRKVETYERKYYVHSSCKPLSEVMLELDNQPSLFESHECEGMCGV